MSQSLSALFYGVSPRDVLSFAGATAVVLVITLVASFWPAFTASRTDPLTALKHIPASSHRVDGNWPLSCRP